MRLHPTYAHEMLSGIGFLAPALGGLDLRMGIRIPLRDIYYDWERFRVLASLGWEY